MTMTAAPTYEDALEALHAAQDALFASHGSTEAQANLDAAFAVYEATSTADAAEPHEPVEPLVVALIVLDDETEAGLAEADRTEAEAIARYTRENPGEADAATIEREYAEWLEELNDSRRVDEANLQAKVDAEAERVYIREKARQRARAMIEAETPLPELVELSLDELMEMPPLEWWVDDVVPKGALVMVAGPGGVGKSAVLVDMALRIATGSSFLHMHKAHTGRVLYVAGEGQSGYGGRFQAARAAHGLQAPGDALKLVTSGFSLSDSRSVERLARRVTEGRFDLVILDTLSALSTLDSENDNAEAARLMNAARSIVASRPGASVVVVHHASKESGLMRGASAYRDNADAVWVLKGDSRAFSMSSKAEHGGKLKDGATRAIKGLSLKEAYGSIVLERQIFAEHDEATRSARATAREAVRAHAGESMTRRDLLDVIKDGLGVDTTDKAAEHHVADLKAEGVVTPISRGTYYVAPVV